MLSNEQVTPLAYESFVSPVSNLIRERACVKVTGATHNFCGRFPFSWVIKDFVNNLLIQVTEGIISFFPNCLFPYYYFHVTVLIGIH